MDITYRIEEITDWGAQAKEFIEYPKRLYKNNPYWVPWFNQDMKKIITKKHPFFLHSQGTFFLVKKQRPPSEQRQNRDSKVTKKEETAARACVVGNTRYNAQHQSRCAHFYFFDVDDDLNAAQLLFEHITSWALSHNLDTLRGPMLFGGAAGSGILIQGFDQKAPMTMMPYNYPYYQTLLENLGFSKHVDLYSIDISRDTFSLPEKVVSLAEKRLQKGHFNVPDLKTKKDLRKIAPQVTELYNTTLGDGLHLEDYPLSEAELEELKKELILIAKPNLVKILFYDEHVVGYLLAFPDLSDVMQKNQGRLGPLEILRLLRGMKTKEKVLINGMGILPKYQRLGGNAVLYGELEKTTLHMGFKRGEMVQISELTEMMLRDVKVLGGKINKIHRIYERNIS